MPVIASWSQSFESSPGVTLSTASERVDTPRSTVCYHVRVLAKADELAVPTILGRRLFPPYVVAPVLAALNDDGTGLIVTALAARDAATGSELAAAFYKPHRIVSYHLDRVDEADVIERYRATPRVSSRLIHKAWEPLRE